MSNLVASESLCAQDAASEGSMNNIFDNGHDFPPPPPPSHSEADPYTASGSCRITEVAPHDSSENFSPLMFSAPRFPPPPNSAYSPAYHPNMTFESLPASHYSSELRAADPRWPPYETWSDSAPPTGLDNSSKFVSYWPFPGFSSYENLTRPGPLKSEALYSAMSASPQYPLCDSTGKSFASTFFSSSRDLSTPVSSPNAVIPSTSLASVSSPHLSSFPPPSVAFDFPHPTTSRFPFNPHASAFYPGKDSQSSSGPCSEDASHYNGPMSNFTSRLALAKVLSGPYQSIDSFHDASSRPMHSPEIAPRPIKSTSPSFFSGPQSMSGSSATSSNPMFVTHSLSSRSSSYGPVCSDGSGARESSCDFPPSSSLPFQVPVPPASATLFNNLYNTTSTPPISGKLKSPKTEEDDTVERFLSGSGALLYHQRMSPEEWRWNQYEALYAQGLVDPTGFIARNRRPTYSYFQNRDQAGPGCVSEAVSGDRNSLFAVNVIEGSKIPNQSGSSLKLAASALAEMLALKSDGAANSAGQNIVAHITPVSGSAQASDVTSLNEGFRLPGRQERLPDDCCSSSGSVPVPKDTNFASNKRETPSRGPIEEGTLSRPHSTEILTKRDSADHVDDVSEDVISNLKSLPVQIKSASSNAFGQSQSSTNAQPLTSWLSQTVDPPVGASKSILRGAHNAISRSSGQSAAAVFSGCGVLQDMNLESSTFQNLNPLFTQSLDVSQKKESVRFGKVTTQPVGALSSEDDSSIAGPFRPSRLPSGPSGPYQEVTSTRMESQLLVSPSRNDHSFTNSLRADAAPFVSEVYTETPRGSLSMTDSGVASRVLPNMNGSSPHTPNAVLTSGFQSLTTSISNLTKVLLAFDSSILPPGDSTWLQESLQSAILRLSECLLLEQARLDPRLSSSNVAGSCATDGLPGREGASTNGPSESLHPFTGARASANNFEPFYVGDVEGGPTLAKVKQFPVLYETPDKTKSVKVEVDKTCLEVNGFMKMNDTAENFDSNSKYSCLSASANGTHGDFTKASEEVHSSEPRLGPVRHILEFVGDQDRLDLSALKKLVAAEAREEELKELVQQLKEKLEFEREESKGTAYLCEKIMQEANVLSSEVQAEARPATERASSSISRSMERSKEAFGSDPPKTSASGTALTSVQPSSSGLDGVEARLAVLKRRLGADPEIGCFSETEPCTPVGFSSPDVRNGGSEGLSGPKPRVVDTMDLGRSSPFITPQVLSQIQNTLCCLESSLVQPEVLSNMNSTCSPYDDVRGLRYKGIFSQKEEEGKETRNNTATHVSGNPYSVEARAQMIRSRTNLMSADGVESSTRNLDDILDLKSSCHDSVISGSPTLENDRYETMNEVCLVRLLDSDGESPRPYLTRRTSSRLQQDGEGGGMLESVNSDAEAVKNIIQSEDLQEEPGWEHVRLPRQESD